MQIENQLGLRQTIDKILKSQDTGSEKDVPEDNRVLMEFYQTRIRGGAADKNINNVEINHNSVGGSGGVTDACAEEDPPPEGGGAGEKCYEGCYHGDENNNHGDDDSDNMEPLNMTNEYIKSQLRQEGESLGSRIGDFNTMGQQESLGSGIGDFNTMRQEESLGSGIGDFNTMGQEESLGSRIGDFNTMRQEESLGSGIGGYETQGVGTSIDLTSVGITPADPGCGLEKLQRFANQQLTKTWSTNTELSNRRSTDVTEPLANQQPIRDQISNPHLGEARFINEVDTGEQIMTNGPSSERLANSGSVNMRSMNLRLTNEDLITERLNNDRPQRSTNEHIRARLNRAPWTKSPPRYSQPRLNEPPSWTKSPPLHSQPRLDEPPSWTKSPPLHCQPRPELPPSLTKSPLLHSQPKSSVGLPPWTKIPPKHSEPGQSEVPSWNTSPRRHSETSGLPHPLTKSPPRHSYSGPNKLPYERPFRIKSPPMYCQPRLKEPTHNTTPTVGGLIPNKNGVLSATDNLAPTGDTPKNIGQQAVSNVTADLPILGAVAMTTGENKTEDKKCRQPSVNGPLPKDALYETRANQPEHEANAQHGLLGLNTENGNLNSTRGTTGSVNRYGENAEPSLMAGNTAARNQPSTDRSGLNEIDDFIEESANYTPNGPTTKQPIEKLNGNHGPIRPASEQAIGKLNGTTLVQSNLGLGEPQCPAVTTMEKSPGRNMRQTPMGNTVKPRSMEENTGKSTGHASNGNTLRPMEGQSGTKVGQAKYILTRTNLELEGSELRAVPVVDLEGDRGGSARDSGTNVDVNFVFSEYAQQRNISGITTVETSTIQTPQIGPPNGQMAVQINGTGKFYKPDVISTTILPGETNKRQSLGQPENSGITATYPPNLTRDLSQNCSEIQLAPGESGVPLVQNPGHNRSKFTTGPTGSSLRVLGEVQYLEQPPTQGSPTRAGMLPPTEKTPTRAGVVPPTEKPPTWAAGMEPADVESVGSGDENRAVENSHVNSHVDSHVDGHVTNVMKRPYPVSMVTGTSGSISTGSPVLTRILSGSRPRLLSGDSANQNVVRQSTSFSGNGLELSPNDLDQNTNQQGQRLNCDPKVTLTNKLLWRASSVGDLPQSLEGIPDRRQKGFPTERDSPTENEEIPGVMDPRSEEVEIYNVRGSKLLFVDGYKYSRKRVNKFGSVSWRCRVPGCHATITTTTEGDVLRLGRSGHTHLPLERPPVGYQPEIKIRRGFDGSFQNKNQGHIQDIRQSSFQGINQNFNQGTVQTNEVSHVVNGNRIPSNEVNIQRNKQGTNQSINQCHNLGSFQSNNQDSIQNNDEELIQSSNQSIVHSPEGNIINHHKNQSNTQNGNIIQSNNESMVENMAQVRNPDRLQDTNNANYQNNIQRDLNNQSLNQFLDKLIRDEMMKDTNQDSIQSTEHSICGINQSEHSSTDQVENQKTFLEKDHGSNLRYNHKLDEQPLTIKSNRTDCLMQHNSVYDKAEVIDLSNTGVIDDQVIDLSSNKDKFKDSNQRNFKDGNQVTNWSSNRSISQEENQSSNQNMNESSNKNQDINEGLNEDRNESWEAAGVNESKNQSGNQSSKQSKIQSNICVHNQDTNNRKKENLKMSQENKTIQKHNSGYQELFQSYCESYQSHRHGIPSGECMSATYDIETDDMVSSAESTSKDEEEFEEGMVGTELDELDMNLEADKESGIEAEVLEPDIKLVREEIRLDVTQEVGPEVRQEVEKEVGQEVTLETRQEVRQEVADLEPEQDMEVEPEVDINTRQEESWEIVQDEAEGNKDSDTTSGVKVKEEPEDGDEDGITSNYIDGILGGKTAPSAAALATHASAKGTTLSQALAQARALPFGRSVLRTIRPAPPKSGAASGHTVTVRTVGSQPQFTVQAPAGAVQPAFPGLTPILTAAPQQTGKVAQGVQIVRQPPPLRPAPKNTVSGRIAIPLTVSGNMVRPLLITPQGGTTSGPQITQTFSLRDVMERQKNASVNVTNAPVATGNKRSAPVRIGPKSPIVISPTPSPDVGDNEEHVEAPTRAKPEFTSWRQRQSADKKELVDRLKDTLFKFCEENLEYSKCLHIRGDVLVIYDDESLSAEFNKHLHGDEISRDNRVRSRNEAARAKALANQNAEEETCQPIIESVTSMAATTPPTRPVAMTTTAQKRAAGLDRILGSWYSRAEDASNESDADADSSGGAHEELADAEWFPPAKKSRVMKRKCAAPTRIIKHSALLPPSEQNTETPSGDSQDEAASLEGEETPEKGPGARVGDGSETRDGGEGAGAETLDRLEGTRGVMPITIAPESDEEEDGEEDVSDNREQREISGAAGNEIEDEMESEEDEDDGDEEDDDDDVLMIDETEKQDKTTEEGNKAQSEEGENGDSATMQKLVNIVNGENSDENSDTVKSSEKGANNKSADNDEQGEGVEEPVVNGNDEVMDSEGSDDDDEFSEDEDEVPEGVEENQEENVEQENTENSEIHENSENGDISENSEVTEKRGRTRSKRDTNDNERDGDEKAEMVNGHASGKDSRTRERSGERNKTPTQFTMTTRKKSVDSRTAEVRKSTEALNTSTSGVKPPPGGKVKVRQEGKVQKTSEKSDSRIAPVERPNTRRLSRRITREDDDFVT